MTFVLAMFTGYRHVQLRSSSNQPLDLSTLFVCCKLEDDSWGVHTAADAAATSELRGGVDAAWPAKKTSARSGAGSTVVRPRNDSLSVLALDKEVCLNLIVQLFLTVQIYRMLCAATFQAILSL